MLHLSDLFETGEFEKADKLFKELDHSSRKMVLKMIYEGESNQQVYNYYFELL